MLRVRRNGTASLLGLALSTVAAVMLGERKHMMLPGDRKHSMMLGGRQEAYGDARRQEAYDDAGGETVSI